MNRLIAILLIPVFVVGNVLVHSNSRAAHQSHGQTWAHIHLSGGGHHDHDDHDWRSSSHHKDHHHEHQHHDHDQDSPDSTPPVAPVEHDSDAVYLVPSESLFTTPERCTLNIDAQFCHAASLCVITIANRPPILTVRPFFRTAGLPLYLLYAALTL
jgi:hypothetical protein